MPTLLKPRCENCGQELTDPISIARRLGPECAMKLSEQLSALGDLSRAIGAGYFDPIATKFFTELRIIETVLNRARLSANTPKIKEMLKKQKRVRGILVRRELDRIARLHLQQSQQCEAA